MDNSMTNYYQGMTWPNYAAYAGSTQYPQAQNYAQYPNPSGVATQPTYPNPGVQAPQQQQSQYYYNTSTQQQQLHYQPTVNYNVPPPPPPPPPPKKNQVSPLCSPTISEPSSSPTESTETTVQPPQQPYMSVPPMPPTFPWVTTSMYAPFLEAPSSSESLPFVPVVMPEDRLKSMTQSVQGQVDAFQTKPLNWSENLIDPKLPRVLKEMFQPLYCKLCTLTLTSPVVAQDHYKGKKHKRKIEVWLEENQQQQPPPASISRNIPPQNEMQMGKNQNGSYPQMNRGNFTPGQRNMPPQKRNLSADSQNRQQHNVRNPGSESLLSGSNATPLGNSSWKGPASQNKPMPLMSVPVQRFQGQNNLNFSGNNSGSAPRFPNPGQSNKRPSQMPGNPNETNPKRVRKDPNKTGGGSGSFDYCHFCDLALSSQINADQHYAGKRHQESLANARQTGNFDDMDRNFGIGTAFRGKSNNAPTLQPGATGPP